MTDQVLTHHDTKHGAYVIQWTNVMTPASKLPIGTFQAWLFANGTVGYVYRDLYGTEQALGSSAVVGEWRRRGRGSVWRVRAKGICVHRVLLSQQTVCKREQQDLAGTWLAVCRPLIQLTHQIIPHPPPTEPLLLCDVLRPAPLQQVCAGPRSRQLSRPAS